MRLIFDYDSYRQFLRDYYTEQKQKNPSFSFATFAKQVGLSSAAHIQLILSGKRNLTVSNIHRVAEALELPQAETEYLEARVHLDQAETKAEKIYYQRRIEELAKGKPKSSSRLRVSSLLASAILPPFLLSVEGKEAGLAEGAGERFGYKRAEVRQILAQLEKEGVIDWVEGKVKLSQRHLILHDQKVRSVAQRNFLARQLGLSQRAFEKMYEKEGKFFAHTFTMSPLGFNRYVDEIKQLISRVTKMSDEESPDSVYQLNVQLFPYEKNLMGQKERDL